jgi:hypothetical protein
MTLLVYRVITRVSDKIFSIAFGWNFAHNSTNYLGAIKLDDKHM